VPEAGLPTLLLLLLILVAVEAITDEAIEALLLLLPELLQASLRVSLQRGGGASTCAIRRAHAFCSLNSSNLSVAFPWRRWTRT